MNIFWDKPQGELYRFENKDELVLFLNKTQIHEDLENFSNDHTFGIKIRLIPDETVYDTEEDRIFAEEMGLDGEYAVEHILPEEDKELYKLKLHSPNFFMEDNEQNASFLNSHFGAFILKPEDITLDERWVFPCNVFIWIEKSFDRCGDVEFKLFSVIPCGEEKTVQKTQELEDKYKDIQIKNLNESLAWQRKQYGR